MLRTMRRGLVTACVIAIGLGMSITPAQAEDLKGQKQKVEKAIASTSQELDKSQAVVIAANERVNQAVTRVSQAQAALKVAESNLTQALQVEEKMAAALVKANQELTKALTEEAQGQANVDAQKDAIGMYARAILQDSMPLVSFAALLNVNSTASLANRVQWNDTVLASNQIDLDNLRVLQAELVAASIRSELARQEADKAKQAADAQVELTQTAQKAAKSARDSMQAALSEEQAAQAAAAKAVEQDKAELAKLKKERDRIDAKIAEQARKAAEAARKAAEAARKAKQAQKSSVSSAGLIWPVSGPITSPYGYRIHPVYGGWRFHDGLDIGAGCGTPIKAAASGKVTDRYYHWSYGYRIFVDHGYVNGRHMVTAYNHMSGYAVGIGAKVSQGDTVGYVGTTGTSTGCHLHLMLWVNGSGVNPASYLP